MSRSSFADWMPYHGDDFEGSESVALMSLAAEGLYHRLLWLQWKNGSLPANLRVLRAMLPAKAQDEFDSLWAEIAPCFEERDGRLVNRRGEVERERAAELARRWRKGADAANQIKAQKRNATGDAAKADSTSATRERDASESLASRKRSASTRHNQTETRPDNADRPASRGSRAGARGKRRGGECSPDPEPRPPPVADGQDRQVDSHPVPPSAPPGVGCCDGTGAEPAGDLFGGAAVERGHPALEHANGAGVRRGGTELTRWWDAEYQRTRGRPYDWVKTGPKRRHCVDASALANLQAQFDHAEIKRRITRYLESPDVFDAKTASPRMFASRYALLAVEVVPARVGSSNTASYLDELAKVPARKVAAT